jgi:hypothetical protein
MDILSNYVPQDNYFGSPYFDRDEERVDPLPHRYIHGGFAGTDTRFSFYFPPVENYGRRFFTSIEGGPGGHEDRAAAGDGGPHSIDFAATRGAFLVESNGGHIAKAGLSRGRSLLDGGITTYRASAETTRLARWFSSSVYGVEPEHGYIYGPSGGGWRTILCVENTRGIWDGAVPYISPAGLGVSFPSIISNLVRVLGDSLPGVVAAHEPGGSGNPFAGLTSHQRSELATAYRAGLQPGAEFQLLRPAPELNVLLTTSVMHADFDPQYFEDFWTVPGYLGADGELESERVDTALVVRDRVTVGELREHDAAALDYFVSGGLALADELIIGLRVGSSDGQALSPRVSKLARGCAVTATSGAQAGQHFACLGAVGDVLILDDVNNALGLFNDGDEVSLDNRRYLAYCFAFRYQVDPRASECRQFFVGAQPIYPQRAMNVADVLAGVRTSGDFEAKVIYVSNTKDTLASPLGGTVQWATAARTALGANANDHLRVWLNDNAAHLIPQRRTPGEIPVVATRLVDWTGVIERAIDDVIAWVEHDVAPPADTSFSVDDGLISLASTAAERGGVQPIVEARVNGDCYARVGAGEPVEFSVRIDVPPNAGEAKLVEWDFDGTGAWPAVNELADSNGSVTARHAFASTGTYYPAVRVTTQVRDTHGTTYGLIRNLDRVRVDVE